MGTPCYWPAAVELAEAQKVENDQSAAQNARDTFFNGLNGDDAALDSAAKIVAAIGTAADGDTPATGLRLELAEAQKVENDQSAAQNARDTFFNGLNGDDAVLTVRLR